jgi:hypothetical protein
MVRTVAGNLCTTHMTGTLSLVGDTLRWQLTGTNGTCGLHSDYAETREFRRVTAPKPVSHEIVIVGNYDAPVPDRSHAYPATRWCGSSPESWVRGNARLDQSSGQLSISIELEADSTLAGPKGRVTVSIRDADGKTIYTVTTDERGIGGKTGPQAAVTGYDLPTTAVPPKLAEEARSIVVEAQCAGSLSTPEYWLSHFKDLQKKYSNQ